MTLDGMKRSSLDPGVTKPWLKVYLEKSLNPEVNREIARISALVEEENAKMAERIMRLKMTPIEKFLFDRFASAKIRTFIMRKYTVEIHEDLQRGFFHDEKSTIRVYCKKGAPFCVSIMPDVYVALTVDGLIEGSVKICPK